jgi:prephenate dehydrogenase
MAAVSDATRVAIIGLGVIGGSAALKLIERGSTPTGYSPDDEDRRLAAAAGVRVASLAESVREADLILIAVPLDKLAEVARDVVKGISPEATVLHACSLQRPDATQLEPDLAQRILGTHPLAGSTRSGFAAAAPDLFRGATVFVEERADRRMRDDAELFWSMAGASRIEYQAPADHDNLMAAISHVPQMIATSLAATLAYSNIPRAQLGPGGRDMTRLAASSWEMWKPLLAATPGRTLAMLESIETELRDMREAILKQTLDDTGVTWSAARVWALSLPPGERGEEQKPS